MGDQYMRDLLRIVVAQVCQTIGYHATQTTPLELLQDTLNKFLHEFARDLRRHAEHYNRTETNLDDMNLTLNSLNINLNELLNYVNNVETVPFALDSPKFPVRKSSNLNFLKPGSNEVLIRPMHIYEHLPPMLPAESSNGTFLQRCLQNGDYEQSSPTTLAIRFDAVGDNVSGSNIAAVRPGKAMVVNKSELPQSSAADLQKLMVGGEIKNITANLSIPHAVLKSAIGATHFLDEEGRPTREISSVVMTTGGFISPAVEGKLPDAIIPECVDTSAKLHGRNAPPPVTSLPGPLALSSVVPPTVVLLAQSTSSTSIDVQPPQGACSETDKNSVNVVANIPLLAPALSALTSTSKNIPGTLHRKKPSNKVEATERNNESAMLTETGADPVIFCDTGTDANLSKKLTSGPHESLPATSQTPTLASKLLKKARKKSNHNISLPGKFPRFDHGNSHFVIDTATKSVPTDKTQRKNRKMLQKMLKPDLDEAYHNDIPTLHRLQVEKVLKKHSKYQKKLIVDENQIQKSSADPTKKQRQQAVSKTMEKSDSHLLLPFNVSTISGRKSTAIAAVPNDNTTAPLVQGQAASKAQVPVMLPGGQRPSPVSSFGHDDSGAAYSSKSEIISDGLKVVGDMPDKNTPIKLSNELDQIKLNIFKKISKQKTPKPVSPNITRMMFSAQTLGVSDNQVINLPSGTTITPAPAPIVHPMFPKDTSVVAVDNSAEKYGNMCGNAGNTGVLGTSHGSCNVPELPIIGASVEQESKSDCVNKPKKRGRKPGSKSVRKTAQVTVEASPGNNTKKTKIDKYFFNQFPIVVPKASNLIANRLQFGSNTPDFVPNIPSMHEKMAGTFKQMREGKKMKTKKNLLNMVGNEQVAGEAIKISRHGKSVPTKEEVNTINKKLMRMDTVLKPLMTFEDLYTGASSKLSPIYKSPSYKKRVVQYQEQPNSNAMSNIPPIALGFPNLLNLYPFSPQPGLIPTAPNILLPRLAMSNFSLPFPNFKPQNAPKSNNSDVSNSEKISELVPKPNNDRSYCNVAPLVPESMKLTSPEIKSDKEECDYPKTPKLLQNLTSSDRSSDKMFKNLDTWNSPSSTSSKSIPVTPGGISLLAFEASLAQQSCDKKNKNSLTPDGSSFNYLSAKNSMPHKNILFQKSSTMITKVLNNDDPIELSDDSTDSPMKLTHSSSAILGSCLKVNLNQTLPHVLTPSLNMLQREDTLISSGIKVLTDIDLSMKEQKKSKKTSKLLKSSGRLLFANTSTTATSANLTELELLNPEKVGVGKLAGGADLIPLPATGLAYSSKTIPSTSLTATVATSFPKANNDFHVTGLFENQSISVCGESIECGNMEMQKRKKEHKKLKKLKEKVRRKKDKKDKSKSKDRFKYLEKFMCKSDKLLKETPVKDTLHFGNDKQLDKDLLKKLKKEKRKKHKQLVSYDKVSALVPAGADGTIIGANKSTSFVQLTAASVTNVSSISSNAALTNVAAALVPKLTLKLGSGQSPTPVDDSLQKYTSNSVLNVNFANERITREPSPELARISPLVTRPPKQKMTSDNANISLGTTVNLSVSHVSNILDSLNDLNGNTNVTSISSTPNSASVVNSLIPPPSPWLVGGTLSASSVLLPQQLLQTKSQIEDVSGSNKTNIFTTVATTPVSARTSIERQSPVALISETNRPSSYIDAEGNRVWICPACGKVDDGSPMIGCDGCDAWYHWVCVGISVAPKDNEDWFCRVCITRKKGIHGSDKRRKRNKKK